MANTIDQAFIAQFETEVHLAYQRMGSKLRTRSVPQMSLVQPLDSKSSAVALPLPNPATAM